MESPTLRFHLGDQVMLEASETLLKRENGGRADALEKDSEPDLGCVWRVCSWIPGKAGLGGR